MSREYRVDYFPPKGTKYEWDSPSLVHDPIHCKVSCLAWPQSLRLFVDRGEKGYWGVLDFWSINGVPKVRKRTRYYKTSLAACKAIERVGDKLLETEPWMKRALELKWRPPS